MAVLNVLFSLEYIALLFYMVREKVRNIGVILCTLWSIYNVGEYNRE